MTNDESQNSAAEGRSDLEGIVRCRFHVDDYPKDRRMTPEMWEAWIVGKLKDAGVPVEGILTFRGIKSGTLTRFDDPADFGAYTYIWTPNIEVRVPVIMRWNAYKPNSEQRKKGIKGRWQQLNAYGRWDNCEPPCFEWRLVGGGAR